MMSNRSTAQTSKIAYVRGDPVRQCLRTRRLGEGVARRPEHRDEDLRLAKLSGIAAHDRGRVPGVVHEQLLARAVILAHHHVELRRPGPVQLAEPANCIPWGCASLYSSHSSARVTPLRRSSR